MQRLIYGWYTGLLLGLLFAIAMPPWTVAISRQETAQHLPAPFSKLVFRENLSPQIQNVIEALRPIAVKKVIDNNDTIISYGTVLMISDSTAMTAYHVMRDALGALVLPTNGDVDTAVVYRVKISNKKADVALLQLQKFQGRGPHGELCFSPQYAVGDTIYNAGFVGDSSANYLIITQGIVLYIWDDEGLYPKIVTSAEGRGGMSGGVIIHSIGCVSGILSHTQFASKGGGYFTFEHYRRN